MRARILIAALCAAAALFAQDGDRTFYSRAETPADLQTVVNVVRSIGDIQRVTMDAAHKSITVSGNPSQLAFADWVSHELDKPATGQPPREYQIAGATPPTVRIYYLANFKTPQEVQEIVNSVRSMADVQRFFPYYAQSAIVARGTADQLAAVDWLIHELDQPPPTKTSEQFPMPGIPGEFARIFATRNFYTPQLLQEGVNLTRSIADIQRFFPVTSRNLIVARGTADQIALAGWLLQQLDHPAATPDAPTPPPAEYRDANARLPLVRLVYMSGSTMPFNLQETVNAVRIATQMQRVFPNNLRKAIAMRGTADQVGRAELLIKERDK